MGEKAVRNWLKRAFRSEEIMKQKVKLNKYKWFAVLNALSLAENVYKSKSFKKLYHDIGLEIKEKLGLIKKVEHIGKN